MTSGEQIGSRGEHALQECYGTQTRAQAFYDHQVLDYLNPHMQIFIAHQEMLFVATSDTNGACDTSFRAGRPGFVQVLDQSTLAYPEYRGNGIMASLGNITENPHIGLLFLDFFQDKIGLHVNGRAQIVENQALLQFPYPLDRVRADITGAGKTHAERWVVVTVEEAYIHCSKHIPKLQKPEQEIAWGTDNVHAKGGDYFKAKYSPRR